ncbi:hypothetical protein [Spiroplasma endosymbiont of Polydrusus pterygomalis]|uniref:hypothetical protein n=1 Tax=Spiroplasma endosymbiont of Polydrusus pterygomalis TaxID=3139327 RepID=UPI003CCABB09
MAINNNNNLLNHSTNEELELSVTFSVEESNVTRRRNETGLFRRIINLFSSGGKRIKKIYNENKSKDLDDKIEKMQAEIKKLEAEKLTSFWNKFWIVISCGCYNNHGKVNRKIKKRNLEIEKIQKELENLTKNNVANSEPQPSTSSVTTNQVDVWSDKTNLEIENAPLPKKKSKNLSSTLN